MRGLRSQEKPLIDLLLHSLGRRATTYFAHFEFTKTLLAQDYGRMKADTSHQDHR